MKAIIPAAGLGTRFLPATKAQPKEMLPVLAKPTIQYVVEEALAAEADEVIIVSNAQKQSIREHFSPDEALASHLEAAKKHHYAQEVRRAGSLPVCFVEQGEPLGLGHAVCCASEKVLDSARPEPFYVLLGDVLVPDNALLPRMLAVSRAHGDASVIAVLRVPREQVSRFGIIAGQPVAARDGGDGSDADVWRISGMVEKPSVDEAPSELAIFGRYLLSAQVMRLLSHTAPGAGGEIQLTDALIELLDHEEAYALIIDPNEGFDVGTVSDWLATNIRLAQRDPALSTTLAGIPAQNEE
ncbi:MAG: NTP transferase domain-containing protein [Coriobacteriales bacterium]|jgi:UTP--glucose-1-phosphate uridylyltransferase|nr:NTP transferase domain-containing protein [Coriobacteriales bacterium]